MDPLGMFRLENDENLPKVTVAIVYTISYAISILLLSTHLIVFSFTEEMWTTMGKNLSSFCVSLLLGFFTFISTIVTRNENQPTSYTVSAVLSYYFSLTHSSWLLCMSNECCSCFSKSRSQREYEKKHSHRFFWYSLFSWVEPAIFLAVAVYLQFWDTYLPTYLKPKFLVANAHFHPTNVAFVIFFVAPLCLNMMLNTMMIFWTLCKSQRACQYGSLSNVYPTYIREFTLFWRLNFLILLSWMLNLSDVFFIGSQILNIFVVFLNAIPALYIFLVFTFNNKISLLIYENQGVSLQPLLNRPSDDDNNNDEIRPPAVSTDV